MIPLPSFNLNPSGRMRSALFLRVAGVQTLFVDGVSAGAATTLVVPANVSHMEMSGSGAGAAGGGGQTTSGGGGGGGGAGMSARNVPLIVTPLSTLAVSVGAGPAAAAAGSNGNNGGSTTVSGFLFPALPFPLTVSGSIAAGSTYPEIQLWGGNGGTAGSAGNGGSGGGASFGNSAGGTGGAGAGGNSTFAGIDPFWYFGSGGGAGGATTFSGGTVGMTGSGNVAPGLNTSAATGDGTRGGGGNGGHSLFSSTSGYGRGNLAGGAAAQAGVWGGGGGGGAGGAGGGAGGDGFLLLTWISPW
jgi:hypothetical protein